MRIISQTKLRAFWDKHADAKASLASWSRMTERVDWEAPINVRSTFSTADTIGDFIVFNVCKNAYRLVVRADYRRGILYVWDVYTHPEYDRLDLRALDAEIRGK